MDDPPWSHFRHGLWRGADRASLCAILELEIFPHAPEDALNR